MNGDGLFDLLVGDRVSLQFAAEGVKESEIKKRLEEWEGKYDELIEKVDPENERERLTQKIKAVVEKFSAGQIDIDEFKKKVKPIECELKTLTDKEDTLTEQRKKIVREYSTGYVWVYYQLPEKN